MSELLLTGARGPMSFILAGDPAEHGGEGVPAPILVYDDGVSFVFAQPSARAPIEFATLGQAIAASERIPCKQIVVELLDDDRSKQALRAAVMRQEGRIPVPGRPVTPEPPV